MRRLSIILFYTAYLSINSAQLSYPTNAFTTTCMPHRIAITPGKSGFDFIPFHVPCKPDPPVIQEIPATVAHAERSEVLKIESPEFMILGLDVHPLPESPELSRPLPDNLSPPPGPIDIEPQPTPVHPLDGEYLSVSPSIELPPLDEEILVPPTEVESPPPTLENLPPPDVEEPPCPSPLPCEPESDCQVDLDLPVDDFD
ncbi:hypothetical protein FPV67DRAFT_1675155 [Lyophyllum atratum]|nr:hypothetical protein FPV67DRAFT_1675155 [Lyophyllum atratum]